MLCKQSGNSLWGFVLLKALGLRGGRRRETGEREEIFYNVRFKLCPLLGGAGQELQANKEAVWAVTVGDKHMATNGVVMGGEATWEKWHKESWHINSGGVTSPLAGKRDHSHPPHHQSQRCSCSQGCGQGEGWLRGEKPPCPAGPRKKDRGARGAPG